MDRHSQSGLSLVAVLIGMAIIGGVIMVIASNVEFSAKMSQNMRMRDNVENLRNHLRLRVNCAETFAAAGAGCIGNALAIKANGKTIVEATGTVIGPFDVVAKCTEEDRGAVKVKAARVTYRKKGTRDRFENLFKDIQLCEENL